MGVLSDYSYTVRVVGQAKRQQNFRLSVSLIERLEAVCGKGRRFSVKSAAVEEALERLLGPEEPAKWATVANPAGSGSLVRIVGADPEAWFPGALARSRGGEVLRVREVDASGEGLLLTVDRGAGRVYEIQAGDELCQVGHVDSSEASPAVQSSALGAGAGSPLLGVSADGSETEGGRDPAAPSASPELGGQGADSAPAPPVSSEPQRAASEAAARGMSAPVPQDAGLFLRDVEAGFAGDPRPDGPAELAAGQERRDRALEARAPFPVGRAELLEGRADSDGARAAAAQEAELVEVAGWLQARTGAPLAVCRKRIAEGRVTIGGRQAKDLASHLAKSMVELVELDGERV